jgi:hypothetical protein
MKIALWLSLAASLASTVHADLPNQSHEESLAKMKELLAGQAETEHDGGGPAG